MSEIERIRASLVSQIQPGDTIVLRHDGWLSRNAVASIEAMAVKSFPGCKVVVLEEGMSIEVYRDKEGEGG